MQVTNAASLGARSCLERKGQGKEGKGKKRQGICRFQEPPGFCAGNLVFHGPREDVVPYFQSLGFYVPERKAVSDFLQEVTSKKDQKVGDHSYIFSKRREMQSICLLAIIMGVS